MADQFSRTRLLYGEAAMKKLASCRVAVFGISGVGGYVVEALARSGIGALDLIDNDKIVLSNLNRQIIATRKNIGQYKVDVAAERVADINPECTVRTYRTFYLPDTGKLFDFREYDYIVDAIDTVTGKLTIIENAKKAGTPVISSMGAGNKTDPQAFKIADIYETNICPLAKVMRKECRKRGITSLKVVYSEEKPLIPLSAAEEETSALGENNCAKSGESNLAAAEESRASKEPEILPNGSRRRSTPGSVAFVPSVAGLIIAGEVVNELTAGLVPYKK